MDSSVATFDAENNNFLPVPYFLEFAIWLGAVEAYDWPRIVLYGVVLESSLAAAITSWGKGMTHYPF